MKTGHPFAQETARIQLRPLPHQQLLLKLLITITVISLALIAIYDNHAIVHTKLSAYRSKIPYAEYPTKIHEYQSKYYDYENIVHERVYDKNVNIDENYIDIDYKTDEENVYDEYGDEVRDTKLTKEAVLRGAGFGNYNKDNRNTNDEVVDSAQILSRGETTGNFREKLDNIYDETETVNEQEIPNTGNRVDSETEKKEDDPSTKTIDDYETSIERINIDKSEILEETIESDIKHEKTYRSVSALTDRIKSVQDIDKDQITNITQKDITESLVSKEKATSLANTVTHPSIQILKSDTIKHSKIDATNKRTVNDVLHTTRRDKVDTTNTTKEQENSDSIIKTEQDSTHITKDISLFKYKIKSYDSNTAQNSEVKPQRKSQQQLPSTDSNHTTTGHYTIFSYTSRTNANHVNTLRTSVSENQIEHKQEVSKQQTVHRGPSQYFARAKRRLPQALIIGVRKCGTRALLEMLYLHPRIQKAAGEVHFFDRDENYSKGLEWYRQQMPLSYPNQVTIEKSPSYFVTPEAPERIRAMNASVRLLVIVRDPVTRAISDYTQLKLHAAATSAGPVRKFEQLALTENGDINGRYRPIAVSMYHNFMYSWLEVFPKEQILLVNGDRLIEDPVPELQRIERFLNLEPRINHDNFYFNHTKGFYCLKNEAFEKCLRESKGRKHVRVHPKVIAKMREYFNYHNQLFYDLVDENFDWPEE